MAKSIAAVNSQPDICRTWTKFVYSQYLYFLIGDHV